MINQTEQVQCKFWSCYMYVLDTIQDFLCKLGMKPQIHLVEIIILSLYHVIVRPKVGD